jgi:hypothetical protein
MSLFLDNKQEVIKLELTNYGKKLFAVGEFKPEFYAFFDEGVIYDLSYVSGSSAITEQQNDIKDRILDGFLALPLLNKDVKQLSGSLGNSAKDSDFAPAWDFKVLNGSVQYLSGSSTYEEKIFNGSDITYTLELKDADLFGNNSPNLSNFEFANNKILIVKDQYLLFDLQEINSEEEYRNFDVEVFVEDVNSEGGLRQLNFVQQKNNIIDDMIYDDNELPRSFKSPALTENNVELFLDVLVDEEIDTTIIQTRLEDISTTIVAATTAATPFAVKDEC